MMTVNALDKSASPFLLQHKDNPVAWQVWSDGVLARAKAEGKPIFLSIGYSGCHACEQMNQDGFNNPDIAALINDNFIPVLVDRDERPDIDQLNQAMSTMMGHGGGWPLTMFLNSDAVPIFAAGYMANPAFEEIQPGSSGMGVDPTQRLSPDRSGRLPPPSFKRVLTDVIDLVKNQPEEAAKNAAHMQESLNNVFNRDMRGPLESIQLDMAAIRIGQRFDIFMGGLTGPSKFPSMAMLEVLWRAFLRTGLSQYMHLVSTTMNSMLLGGLYDHVGGGFFRYTLDERWMIPHFEKSLSDNALMLSFMTGMWQFNRNELCRQRVAETIDWMLREMRLEHGFATSLASNTQGEEGRFYVWTEAEVDAALQGTFSARFKQVYGVKRDGDYNGRNILRRFVNAQATEADETLMTKQRGLLLAQRDKRVRPSRDEKILTAANGQAIRAIAFAGSAFDRADWIAAAASAFDGLVTLADDNGVLSHASIHGKILSAGVADDYVHMAEAALQLYEATGEKRYVDLARKWVETLDSKFWDEVRGGYFFTADDAEKLIIRIHAIYDQPSPSANGAMLSLLTKLALVTGEEKYGVRAQNILTAFAAEFDRNWISCAEYLNGFETFATGLQMVVLGDKARTQELVRAIWGKAMPNRLLVQVDKSEELPPNHPVFGKIMENGRPTVYLCQRSNHSEPITSAVALAQALTLPQQRAPMAAS
jgi:uncharacterized protein